MRALTRLGPLAAAFILGFAVIQLLRPGRMDLFSQDARLTPEVDSLDATGGGELVLVYIGRSTCGWCSHPDLPGLIRQAASHLEVEAQRRGDVLTTLGVSVDRTPEPGLKHLERILEFDALASGGSWSGYFSGALLWKDRAGEAATPQVLVVQRRLTRVVGSSSEVSFNVDDERVVASFTGLQEIRRWVASGSKVPRITTSMTPHVQGE